MLREYILLCILITDSKDYSNQQQSDGEVKNNWVDCRQEVYATRDAMIAAEKYCQGNKLERLSMDRLFDACLMSKDVSQEAFEAALTNC